MHNALSAAPWPFSRSAICPTIFMRSFVARAERSHRSISQQAIVELRKAQGGRHKLASRGDRASARIGARAVHGRRARAFSRSDDSGRPKPLMSGIDDRCFGRRARRARPRDACVDRRSPSGRGGDLLRRRSSSSKPRTRFASTSGANTFPEADALAMHRSAVELIDRSIDSVEPIPGSVCAGFTMAAPVYDTLYLVTARRTSSALLTFDKALRSSRASSTSPSSQTRDASMRTLGLLGGMTGNRRSRTIDTSTSACCEAASVDCTRDARALQRRLRADRTAAARW